MSARSVAVVGSPADPHVDAVANALEEKGIEVVLVDGASYPESLRITLGDRLDAVTIDGRTVEKPAAVYVRDIYAHPLGFGVDVSDEMEQDWRRTLIAMREKAQVLFSLLARWSELVPVYNPPSPEWRLAKPFQLSLLKQEGLPVPDTVWTNDPERVREFAAGRRIAYKPVAGGAATQELQPEDLTDERLQKLRGAPVTFQELLEGDNFRVYCVDEEVVASLRITSESVDFRQNEDIIERTNLPDDVLRQCVHATKSLGLRWSGIDLRSDGSGALRFLEVNSSPMFLGFDARAGTDVQAALVASLASHVE